jgi:SAM-dependent methyltransferase
MAGLTANGGAKTSPSDWDKGVAAMPNARFWSPFDPAFNATLGLLKKHIRSGTSVLEFGFAPGKHLAFVASRLGAKVTGLDYSPTGVSVARDFFKSMSLEGDLREGDLFEHPFARGSFDVVFSSGLVEHFDDPRPILAKHLELVRPGGKAIILLPHYGGIYGRLQARLDPDNLAIHNTGMMSPCALKKLIDCPATTFAFGAPSLWALSLRSTLLKRLAGAACVALPFAIPGLEPQLAIVATPLREP